MPRPKRRATATRTASSSKRNPQEAMGKALSQSLSEEQWLPKTWPSVIIITVTIMTGCYIDFSHLVCVVLLHR